MVAPSANPSGKISPTTAEHVRRHLRDKVAFVLDGGLPKWKAEGHPLTDEATRLGTPHLTPRPAPAWVKTGTLTR